VSGLRAAAAAAARKPDTNAISFATACLIHSHIGGAISHII